MGIWIHIMHMAYAYAYANANANIYHVCSYYMLEVVGRKERGRASDPGWGATHNHSPFTHESIYSTERS